MISITIMALEAERGGSLFLLVQGGRLRRRLTPALGAMEDTRKIHDAFRPFSFGGPADIASIEDAERSLGHPLPPQLKQYYLAYNGFSGPTAAQFFYPLTELVKTTLFLRSEEYFPNFLHQAVAFGDYGVGSFWVIRLEAPDSVIEWDAEWGDDFESLDGSLADVWLAQKARYESISGT